MFSEQNQLYLNIIWLQNAIPLLEVLNIHHMCQLFRTATLHDKIPAFMPILWINRSVWEKIDTSPPLHAGHDTLLNKRTSRQVQADEMFPQIIQRIPEEWRIFIHWIDILLPFGTPVTATDRIRYNRQMIPVFIYEEVKEKFSSEFPTICRLLEINTQLPSFTPQESFSTPFPMVQLASCYYKMLTLYHFPGLYCDTGDVLNVVRDLRIHRVLPNFSCGWSFSEKYPILEDFLILSCNRKVPHAILSKLEKAFLVKSYAATIYSELIQITEKTKPSSADPSILITAAQEARKTFQDLSLFIRAKFPDVYKKNVSVPVLTRADISYKETFKQFVQSADKPANWNDLFHLGDDPTCNFLQLVMSLSFFGTFIECVHTLEYNRRYVSPNQTALSGNFYGNADDALKFKKESKLFTYANPGFGWCSRYAWFREQEQEQEQKFSNPALLPYIHAAMRTDLI